MQGQGAVQSAESGMQAGGRNFLPRNESSRSRHNLFPRCAAALYGDQLATRVALGEMKRTQQQHKLRAPPDRLDSAGWHTSAAVQASALPRCTV